MNYKQLLVLLTILIIPFVAADRVGVLIDFPDGSIHVECLEADKGTDGYELLSQLSLSTLFSSPGSFGHQLCQINNIGDSVSGTGCSYSGKYWRFLNGINNLWEYMPIGFDAGNSCWNGDLSSYDGHYCVNEGNVIGLSYGEYDDPRPAFYNFDQICNPISINKIKVYVDNKKESDADESGGDIEAEPGSKIEFKIELENIFEFDDNLEIEGIEAEITIENINDNKDIDEGVKFKDLDVEEDDEEIISITLPLVLEDDNYDIELKITGENSNGVNIEKIINYDLNIDKENHNLRFSKLKLDSEDSCPNTNNLLSIEISNLGEKDENNARIIIKSQELNIDFADRFDIDEGDPDDTYRKDIPFTIPNLSPGDYKINLNLDYSEILHEDITLTINDCNQAPITGNTIQKLDKITAQATPNNKAFQTQTFLQNYAIPILLGVFLLLLIIAIIYIVSIL
jgi:hypothetical protein